MAYQKIPSPDLVPRTPPPPPDKLEADPSPDAASLTSFTSDVASMLTESSQYEPSPMEQPLLSKPNMRPAKSRACFIISIAIGLAWLAPIMYLLVVNIRGISLGASAWCPSNEICNVISYTDLSGSSTATQSIKNNEINHNLMGALQFVAKALEAWFVFIATSLVWQFTVLLARHPEGLPIGYMLTHLEFTDVRMLLDPILYRTSTARRRNANYVRHLRLFVVVAVLMCILANLMGPSIAVLLLPTLGYHRQDIRPTSQFNQLLGTAPPIGDQAIPGCTAADLDAKQYNCTDYADVLESLSTSQSNEIQQNLNAHANLLSRSGTVYTTNHTAVTVEELVPFAFNTTTPKEKTNSSGVAWAPLRQTIRDLSHDFNDVFEVVTGAAENQTLIDHFTPYINSYKLIIQRFSPVIGLQLYSTSGNVTITYVANDRQIRCYHNYDNINDQTKCMRTGTGWNTTDVIQSFGIDGDGNDTMDAIVYWSDRAIMQKDPNDPCLIEGTLKPDNNCDWDAIFSDAATAPSHATSSSDPNVPSSSDKMRDMLIIEWGYDKDERNSLLVEVFPGFGFATYSLDITKIYPTLKLMEIRDTPEPDQLTPMVIHPAWFLAGWNVANDMNLAASDSDAAYIMRQNLDTWFSPSATNEAIETAFWAAHGVTWYALLHGASMIPYSTEAVPSDTADLPALRPLLWNNVYNKVWGWGIDSRTSKLGVVVAALGIVTVIARTFLLLSTRAKERSPLSLMISAVKYQHLGELDRSSSERENAKVCYKVLGTGDDTANISLMHVD